MTSKSEKLRAVFLTALMIGSVFGAGIAFTGSAAAATPAGGSLSDNIVQPGTEVAIEEVDANEDGNQLYILAYNETSESIEGTTPISENDVEESESWSTTFTPNSADLGLEDGDSVTIFIGEGQSDSDLINEIGSLTVDDTAPTVGSNVPSNGATISTTTPEIVFNLSEDVGINTSTLEVSAAVGTAADDGENQLFELNEPSAQGLSYDSSTQNLTVNVAETKLGELPEDQVTVAVSGADEAGNPIEGGEGSLSTTFTVDTNPVTVDIDEAALGAQDDGAYTSGEQTFTVDVSSTAADIDTAEVTIAGAGDYEHTFTTGDEDVYETGTFTIEAGPDDADDISTLPDGTVTVNASATDADSESNEDGLVFEVDTQAPSVDSDSITINDGNIVNTDNAETVIVEAVFNESVAPDTVVGTVHVDTDGTAEADLDDTTVQNESATTTLEYEVDLSGTTVENSSAEVRFSSVEDEHGNLNDSVGVNQTFEIDTENPSVTLDDTELPKDDGNVVLANVVDLSEAFSASNADGNAYSLYVDVGKDTNYVPLSELSSEPLADFDTTTLDDGAYNLKINVTDAAGNTVSKDIDFYVDNEDPSVTSDVDTLTGVVDISEVVSVSGNGTETATFGYTETPEEEVTFTKAETIDVNDLGTGHYTLAVEVNDPGYGGTNNVVEDTVTISGESLQDGTLDISASENANDAGEVNVTVESSVDLSGFNVSVTDDDNYYQDFSAVTDSGPFTQNDSVTDSENYEYTATFDAPRDGDYDFTLENASLGAQYHEPDTTVSHTVDNSTPTIVDADIAGVGTDGRTQVQVQFSEPVTVSESDVESLIAGDGTAVNDGIDVDGSDGTVVVEFDDILQTGDGLTVTYAEDSITEAYDADGEDNDANGESISRTVDTIDLQLSEGQNLVSVPAETGSVSISELNTDNVETIYAWDDDGWTGYAPDDPTSELENLKGGQGYVFVMTAADEIPVQAYNKPGAVEGGVAPMTDEEIDEGWNLIGHFQEAAQDRGTALTELDDATYDASQVLGQQSDGSYGPVAQFQPGEAYWLHADQTDNYAATPFTGAPVVTNIQITEEDGTQNLEAETGESVNVTAEVSDTDGVDTVTADLSANLNGPSDLTLTDENGDGNYTSDYTEIDLSGVAVDQNHEFEITAIDNIDKSNTVTGTVYVASTGDAGAGGGESVDPAQVQAGTSVTDQTIEFDVTGISADGGTDTFTVTVPGTSELGDPSVSINDGSDGSVTGSANVVGGDEISFDTSADDGTTYDATLTLEVDATYNEGTPMLSYKLEDSDGDTVNEDIATVTADGTAPDTPAPAIADTTTSNNQPSFSLDIIDDDSTDTGVDESSISVTVADSHSGDGAEVDAAGTGTSGIDFNAGTLTVDLSTIGETLEDGTVDVTVNVDDEVGNSATEAFSFTVDTSGSDLQSVDASTGGQSGEVDVSATASSSEGGTIYYVVVSDGATAPSATNIQNGNNDAGDAALDSGSTSVDAGGTLDQTATGLGAGTSVDVYFVQVDAVGNAGAVDSDTEATAGG